MNRLFIKSLCALSLAALAVLPAEAHIRKGTTVIQGDASLSSSSGALYNNSNLTNFVLSPSVRYFVIDHLAVGGEMLVDYVKQGPDHSTAFDLGPSVAYYFGNLDGKTIPYLGGSVLFRTLDNSVGNVSSSENGTALSLFGGFAGFLSDHLAVTPELSVNFESLGGHTGTTLLVGAGLAGFLYHPTYRAPRR